MTRENEEIVVERFKRAYDATPEDPAARARLRHALSRTPARRGPWLALVGVAAAAALASILIGPGKSVPPVTADSLVTIHFVLVSQARQVSVVGDFNNWDPTATPMAQGVPNSLWQVSAKVGAGRVEYAFVLDGKTWIPDPNAPLAPESEFGTRNSVLTTPAPGAL